MRLATFCRCTNGLAAEKGREGGAVNYPMRNELDALSGGAGRRESRYALTDRRERRGIRPLPRRSESYANRHEYTYN